MFCVECGKDGPIFRDGVCKECYLKTHSFSKGPASIDMPVCVTCNSFKYKNSWTSELFGDVVRRMIKNSFDISRELEKVDINTECKEAKEGMACKVYISGFIDDVEIAEEHDLLVRLKKAVCDVCSKQSGGYYEAIVQIRPSKKKLSAEELETLKTTVETLVASFQAKGNRSLFITDSGEEHGGLDFFISDRNTGFIIAKKIQEQYGGEIKQSSKNVGMKDSKQLYRVTYLVRLPAYKKDDFFHLDDLFYLIKSIHGNTLKIINLANWEESTVDFKLIQKAKIIGDKELIKEMILLDEKDDEVQIMDEKTYEVKIIRKPKSITFKSEKIHVVKIDEQIFLLPK